MANEIVKPDSTDREPTVPDKLRSVFDFLVNSQDHTRLKNVEAFLEEVKTFIGLKENRRYIIKRLVTGISTTRSSACTAFAVAFIALLNTEVGEKLRTEKILETLNQEFDLDKLLKKSSHSPEECGQLLATITIIASILKIRDEVCLAEFAKVHEYILSDRKSLKSKVTNAYDSLLFDVLQQISKSDYKNAMLVQFSTSVKKIEKDNLPLDVCLELLVVQKRFPKLISGLSSENEKVTDFLNNSIFELISEEKIAADVKNQLPFVHPVLKCLVVSYTFDSESFQKLWSSAIKKYEKSLLWILIEFLCGEEAISQHLDLVFSVDVLKLLEGLVKTKANSKCFESVKNGLEKLSDENLFRVLLLFLENIKIVGNFLSQEKIFLVLMAKLDDKYQIKIGKEINRQICAGSESCELCLKLVCSLLRRNPVIMSQKCFDKLLSSVIKFCLLIPEVETLTVKDETKTQIMSMLRQLLIHKKQTEMSFANMIEVISSENKEKFRNKKAIKSLTYMQTEGAVLKNIISAVVIDISLNNEEAQAIFLEEAFKEFIKSEKIPEFQFENVLKFSFSLLSLPKTPYAQFVLNEFKTYIDENKVEGIVEKTFAFYDALEKPKPGKEKLKVEIDDVMNSGDQSESSESEGEQSDNGVELEVPENFFTNTDEDIVIDLDGTLDKEQQDELLTLDERLESVLVMKRKTGNVSKQAEPIACFFQLATAVLSSKKVTVENVKTYLIEIVKRASEEKCPEVFKVNLFTCFELPVFGKSNFLTELVTSFEKKDLSEMGKKIVNNAFAIEVVFSDQALKNMTKFLVSYIMQAASKNLLVCVVEFVSEYLTRKKYPKMRQFLSIVAGCNPEAFWQLVLQGYRSAMAKESKDLANVLNNTLLLLTPEIVRNIPESCSEILDFFSEFSRKLLQESVKSSCHLSTAKNYFQFVASLAQRHEQVGASKRVLNRVSKTLTAFETVSKDSASINMLRNLARVFRVDDETIASVTYLSPVEKDDRKKVKRKNKVKPLQETDQSKRVKIG